MSIKENSTEEVFIGARKLSPEQVKLILPTYEIIFSQIEEIRRNAKNSDKQISKEYNNTISIFGSRGTGKTSAIYTIISRLKENSESGNIEHDNGDIILPTIEPDNFGDNTKIMGAILGFLGEEVENILKKIKEKDSDNEFGEYFNTCIYKENNPLTKILKSVYETYFYTEKEYRDLIINNYEDKATHIKNSAHLLKPDADFKNKLNQLFSKIIEAKKKLIKSGEEPLIYIFIDDIDLKTTKCKELIETIMQYTNYPNVITFLSGDYDILKEAITLSLIDSENLHKNNITPRFKINSNDTLFERKQYLANEYLKKIIPPSMRHNVVKWNIENIPHFSFYNSNNPTTLSEQLDNLMGEGGFFNYKQDGKNIPLNYAYCIFDKTPRGLVNVYYQINRIINTSSNNEDFINFKALIETIILSSRQLIDYEKEIFNKYILWGSELESSSINFDLFDEMKKNDVVEMMTGAEIINKFSIFIIGEMIKEIFPNIKYDELTYTKNKKLLMKFMFLYPSIWGNTPSIYKKFNKKTLNLYELNSKLFIIMGFSENISFKDNLILLGNLAKFKYNYREKDSDKAMDNNVFIEISKIFINNAVQNKSTLLINLYKKSRQSKDGKLKALFNFLQRISADSQEYKLTEKTFEFIHEKLEENFKSNEYNKIFDDRSKAEIENRKNLLYMLFINWLREVHKTKYPYPNEMKYKKWLLIIKNVNDKKIEEISEKERRQVDKIIEVIGEDIASSINWDSIFEGLPNEQHLIENYNSSKYRHNINYDVINTNYPLNIQTSVYVSEEFKDFLVGRNGGEKTKYNKVKDILFREEREIEERYESFIDFYKTYTEVHELSKNTRIWYGYTEANKLIRTFRNESRLSSRDFSLESGLSLYEIEPILHEISVFKRNIDKSIREDTDFEENRIKMQNILDISFIQARQETKEELEELGINLEDSEEGEK